MASLLTINELQKITGGWVCRCSRSSGRYVYMSENSCTKTCCVEELDYYKFDLDHDRFSGVKFCSKAAQSAYEVELRNLLNFIKKPRHRDSENSDDCEVIY